MLFPRAEIGLLAGVVVVFLVAALSLPSRTPPPPPLQETREIGGGLVAVVPPQPAAATVSEVEPLVQTWWWARAGLVATSAPLPPSPLRRNIERGWQKGVRLVGGQAEIPPDAKGMTWGKRYRDDVLGIEMVGCWDGRNVGCDAYRGDTECGASLPLLCVKIDGRPRPPYRVRYPAKDDEPYYGGWLGGEMAITPPVRGVDLVSLDAANGFCRERFGEGWRMAEHHDGRYQGGMDSLHLFGGEWDHASAGNGGWNFYAAGSVPEGTRFWVTIDDQKASCWDSW